MRSPVRRLIQLFAGLWIFGISIALMVRSHMGLAPWDVLHQGLADRFHVSIGYIIIAIGVLVLLLWIPLREKPGLGTVANTVLIGIATNQTLTWLPAPHELWAQWAMFLSGVMLNGIAVAAYLGSRFGPGPRDGLMTGLMRVTGRSVSLIRTGIEITVLILGWLLGGTVGLGTVVYALGIGPVAQIFMPLLDAYRTPGSPLFGWPRLTLPWRRKSAALAAQIADPQK